VFAKLPCYRIINFIKTLIEKCTKAAISMIILELNLLPFINSGRKLELKETIDSLINKHNYD